MIEMFCKNLPMSKELDVQESVYGDELLSMACHVLVQVLGYVTKLYSYIFVLLL